VAWIEIGDSRANLIWHWIIMGAQLGFQPLGIIL
jgi:hypothetical protein